MNNNISKDDYGLSARILRQKREEEERLTEETSQAYFDMSKTDGEKWLDLIRDFETLTIKYQFTEDHNKKLYRNVNILIDKTVGYIAEKFKKD